MKIPCRTRFLWPGHRRALAAALVFLVLLASPSCSSTETDPSIEIAHIRQSIGRQQNPADRSSLSAAETVTPAATPTAAPTATMDDQLVKPNELGRVPILEYHLIEDKDGRWSRSYASFRMDLQKLYDAGFRPISMDDLLDNRIDIPAGTSPVVITFDDSSPGQLRFVQRDGQVTVDPNCAVGIMEAFHAAHPDFRATATFFVLPAADPPHNLFGQDEFQTQKLQYLVQHGFDIGNHTYWHQRLDEINDEEVQQQLGMAVKAVQQAVPGYQERALALPLGMWPQNRALALDGSFQGTTYHNDAILLVGSEPALSPNHRGYDPLALPRVQVFDDNLDRWIAYLARESDERYVSDGDPDTISFPSHLQPQLNPASVGNKKVQPY